MAIAAQGLAVAINTVTLRLPLVPWFHLETWEKLLSKRERGRAGNGGGVSLGGADGVSSSTPHLCCEGGGGTQLLGSRGHSLAQRVWSTLPGRASLAPTSPLRHLWRKKWGSGEKKEKEEVA